MPTDIKEKFHRVERLVEEIEVNKVSRPKIQRVPEHMAAREEFKKFYLPQIISIGPIHGQGHLRDLGRSHKYTWTAMYTAEHANGEPRSLYDRVVSGNNELKQQCDVQNWSSVYDEWDLLLDGCSILQVLAKSKSDHSVDPVRDLKISMDKLVRMHQDLLILDNQIPFKVLRLLCSDEARLNECLHNFLEVHGVKMAHMHRKGEPVEGNEEHNAIVQVEETQEDEDDDDPVHLLDYLRRSILMRDLGQIHMEVKFNRRSWHLRKYRIGTIQELKAAGIHVRKHPNNKTSFYPIFNDGKLLLPELTIDGSTAHIYFNLIAYEMCPDFSNNCEISSFVVLMNSLIDHPEDVKELRSAGVLINELASDKQVADLFNKMDIVLVPETATFAHVRDQIQSHFESKRGKIKILSWMGEASNQYFRTPWTIIALLTCSIGLVLSFLQTWFAVNPKD